MPNHFHFMILVNDIELPIDYLNTFIEKKTESSKIDNITEYEVKSNTEKKMRTMNQSIGIMLRSYSQAVNKQNNVEGKLIREKTKAECINCSKGVTPSFITAEGMTKINFKNPKEQYPQVCFDYIHSNPVRAGIVKSALNWEFSSAIDYAGMRTGNLVNKDIAKEYIFL